MKSVFISHSSVDKPFVFRLVFELLAEGLPVWLDSWELNPGDPLIANLDDALDGSACVLVVMSSHAVATEWVKYEVQKTIEAEKRLGKRLLVPIVIDDSAGLSELKDRIHINIAEGAAFMDGVHAVVDHLRSLGFSADSTGRCVLPLAFYRKIELDAFLLDRILVRRLAAGLKRSDILPETIHLLKSERYSMLQRRLRARISDYWSGPRATAEGFQVLRMLDEDVVRKERHLRERTALILREFGQGFGLADSQLVEVVRLFARRAMHPLMGTLEAADVSEPQTTGEFYSAFKSLPEYKVETSTAEWWNIDDPITVNVRQRNLEGEYNLTSAVILPKSGLAVPEADIAYYPGMRFREVFRFDARVRFVLPQMIYWAPLGGPSSPAAWNEDHFRVWQSSD